MDLGEEFNNIVGFKKSINQKDINSRLKLCNLLMKSSQNKSSFKEYNLFGLYSEKEIRCQNNI